MLGILRNSGLIVYRTWFYVLVALPIFVFSPFLLLTTLSPKTYAAFYWLARNIWAKPILWGMGCFPRLYGREHLDRRRTYMLVANHTSMLDIMLMLYVSTTPFVFVGKKELAKIPVFGFFYKRVCILVDRNDSKSRTAVYRAVQKRLDQGLGICIFPEGGVPDEAILLDEFKNGAFRMAINHGLGIAPFVFLDCKKRFPWTFFKGGPGPLRVVCLPIVSTKGLQTKDTSALRNGVRDTIHAVLRKDA